MTRRLVVAILALLPAMGALAGDAGRSELGTSASSGVVLQLGKDEKTVVGRYVAETVSGWRFEAEAMAPFDKENPTITLVDRTGLVGVSSVKLTLVREPYWANVAKAWRDMEEARSKCAPNDPECADYKTKAGEFGKVVTAQDEKWDPAFNAICHEWTRTNPGSCTTTSADDWASAHADDSRARKWQALRGMPLLRAQRRRYGRPQLAVPPYSTFGGTVAYSFQRQSVAIGSVAATPETLTAYDFEIGAVWRRHWGGNLSLGLRAGYTEERSVKPDGVDVCASVPGLGDGETGTRCRKVSFLAARPDAVRQAFARLELNALSRRKADGNAPAFNLDLGCDRFGKGATFDARLRLYLTPVGSTPRVDGGGTLAGRFGLGLDLSYALSDDPNGSYRSGDWPTVRPFAFVAMTF